MKKLLKIVKETDNKYLNLYHAIYQYENGKVKEYEFASRRNQERLVLNNNERRADAVRILPYIYSVARELNFAVFDLFILLAKNRIGYQQNQNHARKYHCYFLVLKCNKRQDKK